MNTLYLPRFSIKCKAQRVSHIPCLLICLPPDTAKNIPPRVHLNQSINVHGQSVDVNFKNLFK